MKKILLILATVVLCLTACSKIERQRDEAMRLYLRYYLDKMVSYISKNNSFKERTEGREGTIPINELIDTAYYYNSIKNSKWEELEKIKTELKEKNINAYYTFDRALQPWVKKRTILYESLNTSWKQWAFNENS